MSESNKEILRGMEWALTPFALAEIRAMEAIGLSFDLALALIDYQVESGVYEEADIYTLPVDP